VEVAAADVVKVVAQFLKENQLTESLRALQEEAQVALNTVDDVEAFVGDVQQGRWDTVMQVVSTMRLPQGLLFEIYEQLVLDMLEMRELDTARHVLRTSAPMAALREAQPERHARLESIASRPFFDARDAYPDGSTAPRRRAAIAERLRGEVSVVPPSRLLTLLGQSLKWQQMQGQLPAGAKFDLLRGAAAKLVVEPETYISGAGPVIRFGKKSHAECAAFSPDGQFLVSGSVDGFLEVWDFEKGKLRHDLAFQARDEMMMHDEPVLSLAYSNDAELLASGSQEGQLKVMAAAPTFSRSLLLSAPLASRGRCGGCAPANACAASPRRTRRASPRSPLRVTACRSPRAPSTPPCASTGSSRARAATRARPPPSVRRAPFHGVQASCSRSSAGTPRTSTRSSTRQTAPASSPDRATERRAHPPRNPRAGPPSGLGERPSLSPAAATSSSTTTACRFACGTRRLATA
jgi:hypothetical protein